ncbi:MAG: response regulator [Phascolarctobacterium sp.]|nr:response regulator [Phascolarctobacterium sp.]
MLGMYSIMALVLAAVLFIDNFRTETYQTLRREVDKTYANMVRWLIWFCLVDAAWGFAADSNIKNNTFLYVVSAMIHLNTAISAHFWIDYIVHYMGFTKGQTRFFTGLAKCIVLVIAVMLFIGLDGEPAIFYVDAAGVYQTGQLREISFLVRDIPYFTLGIFSIYYLFNHDIKEKYKYYVAILFVAAPIAFSRIQLYFPYVPFFTVGYTLGCCIINAVLVYSEHKNLQQLEYERQLENRTDAVLRVVTEDYICLIDVDLSTEQQTRYFLNTETVAESIRQVTEATDYTSANADFISSIVAPSDKERFLAATEISELKNLLKDTKEFTIEYDAVLKDSTRRFQQRFTMGTDAANKERMYIAIRDITDAEHLRFETEKILLEAREEAEAANRAKSTFLFNMSHDIRTPMNAIVGFTNLLERHGDDPKKRANYITKIQTSNEYMLSLINNVLEMSRIESGKTVLDEKVWNMEQLFDSIHSVFQPEVEKHELDFKIEYHMENKCILCDPTKLREIYLNILSNAVKYTPAGGKVTLFMEEFPSEKEGYACYKTVIADTGIGMSPDFLPTLFEEFSRERNSTESGIQGTGLGMAITKRIVNLMGGTIEVESELGKGSVFTVILPLKIASEEESKRATNMAKEYADVSFIGKRILLAEDNDLNAEIATEILQEAGFEVNRAEDGDVCVRMLKEAAPGYYDVILMDIQMPRMNGYEATRQIRKMTDLEKAGIPILAMTANAFEEDRRNAIEVGMNGHIAKPIDVGMLMESLAAIFK